MYVGGYSRKQDGRRNSNVPNNKKRESDHQKLVKGVENLSKKFERQMSEMTAKMIDMERKQDVYMQQSEIMIRYIKDKEEAESKWKSLAEERLKRYSDAMNEVAELMNAKKDLEQRNEHWRRGNLTLKKKLESAVEENENIKRKVALLLDENRQLRDDIFQVAEALGGDGIVLSLVAEDCGFGAEGEWDEKRIKDKQMARNHAVATIVMCYVNEVERKKPSRPRSPTLK